MDYDTSKASGQEKWVLQSAGIRRGVPPVGCNAHATSSSDRISSVHQRMADGLASFGFYLFFVG